MEDTHKKDIRQADVSGEDLFGAYPYLVQHIDRICRGVSWVLTGASALLYDDQAFYFEITKPEHWGRGEDGDILAGIGAIGGSIEPGEKALACLYREAEEEIGAPIEIASAERTHFVYEERVMDSLVLETKEYPLPVLFTISENLYRRSQLASPILAIVTFLARLQGPPKRGDLHGLLAIPRDQLASVFGNKRISLARLLSLPGVRVSTQEPLPEDLVLSPIWTARSFQLLLQAGRW
ncbi:MAG: hypothetical protein A2Y73_08640 [Chloroflexi bacterium RBG_13_56_8]|nr:MAG: hypothetical protein A2Y73_08640 [Chloroflexi bacterium RBG_13_56_8]